MEPTLAPTFETLAAAARVWLHRHVAELRERFPGARFYPRDLRDHAVDTRAGAVSFGFLLPGDVRRLSAELKGLRGS